MGRQAGSNEELLSAGLGNTRVLTDLSHPLALWALDEASLTLPSQEEALRASYRNFFT